MSGVLLLVAIVPADLLAAVFATEVFVVDVGILVVVGLRSDERMSGIGLLAVVFVDEPFFNTSVELVVGKVGFDLGLFTVAVAVLFSGFLSPDTGAFDRVIVPLTLPSVTELFSITVWSPSSSCPDDPSDDCAIKGEK